MAVIITDTCVSEPKYTQDQVRVIAFIEQGYTQQLFELDQYKLTDGVNTIVVNKELYGFSIEYLKEKVKK